MAITVSIPSAIRNLTENKETLEMQGSTVREVLGTLLSTYPALQDRIRDASGNIRKNLIVYVNGEDIRFLEGEDTPVKSTDEFSIIPAVAGG